MMTYVGSSGVPLSDAGYVEGAIVRCEACGAQNRIGSVRGMVKLKTSTVEEDYDDT
jgi:hypothetical protein